jgi:hypothetical protein
MAPAAQKGKPTLPMRIYKIWDATPPPFPKQAPERRTHRVCRVKGTGVKGSGIETKAPRAVIREKSHTLIILLKAGFKGMAPFAQCLIFALAATVPILFLLWLGRQTEPTPKTCLPGEFSKRSGKPILF